MYFYSHLVKIESLITELDDLQLDKSQKQHLANLVDDIIHQTILDMIFSKLSFEQKKEFLHLLHKKGSHKQVVAFLQQEVENIETEIQNTADDLVSQLKNDIKRSIQLNKRDILKKGEKDE